MMSRKRNLAPRAWAKRRRARSATSAPYGRCHDCGALLRPGRVVTFEEVEAMGLRPLPDDEWDCMPGCPGCRGTPPPVGQDVSQPLPGGGVYGPPDPR